MMRAAFSRVWPDCRLQTAEQRLLGFFRGDDVPGDGVEVVLPLDPTGVRDDQQARGSPAEPRPLRLGDEARGERRDVRDLTDRELAVLKCLAGGQSNKVIARNLSITEGTVKVHVKHLLKKLGFRSRVEAAVWASEQGLRVPA